MMEHFDSSTVRSTGIVCISATARYRKSTFWGWESGTRFSLVVGISIQMRGRLQLAVMNSTSKVSHDAGTTKICQSTVLQRHHKTNWRRDLHFGYYRVARNRVNTTRINILPTKKKGLDDHVTRTVTHPLCCSFSLASHSPKMQ